MKICLYSLSPKVGGGVVVKTMLLLRYLIAEGHDVVWVYPKIRGTLPSYVKVFLDDCKLKIIEKRVIPYFRVLDSIDFFSEIEGDFDIHQVVSGYCLDGMIFRGLPQKYFIWSATTLKAEKYAISFLRIRTLKHVASYINFKLGLLLENFSANRAYKIFAASNPSKINIINEFELDSRKVEIVHPIIDTDKYAYNPISARTTQEPYVLYMGIFSGRKNIDLLVNSFVLVHKKNPLIKLKLVGKLNGFEDYFKNLIEVLDLQSCIEIVGDVADNTVWYQNAMCTALTSFEEGFGMALAESLSCGTPVISTNSGGVTDIVKDGINGFLVGFTEQEVSDAILKLYDDLEMRESFSINGRQHVVDSFSVSTIGSKIVNEYKLFLDSNSNED
ncbi:glycosyltransferase family 4 protein [Gammaproteobacteria bacterium]|nr:glycosyltransferase family 4 protein [Gammaproteobacteria bacterium]MDC3397933.1 glycosyltransferase family 4 protein [Gammaproteobacteria bacterium]